MYWNSGEKPSDDIINAFALAFKNTFLQDKKEKNIQNKKTIKVKELEIDSEDISNSIEENKMDLKEKNKISYEYSKNPFEKKRIPKK